MASARQIRQRNLLAECPTFPEEASVRFPSRLCLETLPEFSQEKAASPMVGSPNRWNKAISLLFLCLSFFFCDMREAEELE